MLVDSLGRVITYLRLSVTDRCNLRCSYCMGEDVVFVPRSDTLRTDEMVRLSRIFVELGIRTIRITGGEPLTRPHVMSLVESLGQFVSDGRLSELTLTTNGTRLAEFASSLHAVGVRRINVSLDTLDADTFFRITKHHGLNSVIEGIHAARTAGIAVRINTVVLGGINDHEISRLIAWCGESGCDMSLIEAMPMGGMAAADVGTFVSLDEVVRKLGEEWTMNASPLTTPGPSRYFTVEETGRKIGLISPLSHEFCGSCNRIRLTCTGKLHLCLAHEAGVDLRGLLRASEDDAPVKDAILSAMNRKPLGHDFLKAEQTPVIESPMWRVGG